MRKVFLKKAWKTFRMRNDFHSRGMQSFRKWEKAKQLHAPLMEIISHVKFICTKRKAFAHLTHLRLLQGSVSNTSLGLCLHTEDTY